MERNYCFVGGGNIAKALIGGLIANGISSKAIRVSDPSAAARYSCRSAFGVQTFQNTEKAVSGTDIIILAVKPYIVEKAAMTLKECCEPNCLLISVAAGVRLSSLERWIGEEKAIARAMPNTPVLVSRGATAVKTNNLVSERQKKIIEDIFGEVGMVRFVETEESLDAVTAISGSGPAYFFLFTELLEKAAIELGLTDELARELASETFCGAAALLEKTQDSATELRHKVTSPGGTTEKAIESFEQNNLYASILEAAKQAKNKSISLSEE